jgi:poly(3-hydroxybutyrate) depolymerase
MRNKRRFAVLSGIAIGFIGLAGFGLVQIRAAHAGESPSSKLKAPVVHATELSNRLPSGTTKASPVSPRLNPNSTRLISIPGFAQEDINVNGVIRHYYLQAPSDIKTPVPLVIALHGLNSTPAWIAGSTGLAADARAAHVALAVPVTMNGAWNDGRLGPNGPNDQAFIMAIVKQTEADKIADPNRVVIGGFSNGAVMSLTMASLYPHAFAAVVSISGELPDTPGAPRPIEPIPAYFTHGMADKIQPYDGRSGNGKLYNPLISEDATVADFVKANNAGAPTTKSLPHGPAATGAIEEVVYPARHGGAPVTLYKLPGVGHKWPAASTHQPLGNNIVPAGFSASDLIIKVAQTSSR